MGLPGHCVCAPPFALCTLPLFRGHSFRGSHHWPSLVAAVQLLSAGWVWLRFAQACESCCCCTWARSCHHRLLGALPAPRPSVP